MPAAAVRLTQAARMLGLAQGAGEDAVRAAIAAEPAAFAGALFAEAADSDDVTDKESALAYLGERLAFFGEMVPRGAAGAVRAAFAERLRAWE